MMNLHEMINTNLLKPEVHDHRYENSIFHNIKRLSPKVKGSRFEMIVEDVLSKLNYNVRKPENTDHDRVVNGVKTEIKGSTLAKGTDRFSFLQIRPDQDYDEMLFAMFYPNELVLMKMTKEDVMKNIKDNIFKKQHGGIKGKSRTYCYYGNRETLKEIGATEFVT